MKEEGGRGLRVGGPFPKRAQNQRVSLEEWPLSLWAAASGQYGGRTAVLGVQVGILFNLLGTPSTSGTPFREANLMLAIPI